MLTASASTRSDFTVSWARSTALRGGGPGRMASQAIWKLDITRYTLTRTIRLSSDRTCTLPWTGTRGSGRNTVMSRPTARPDSTLAAETLPHNRTHTAVRPTSTQMRSMHHRIVGFFGGFLTGAHLPPPGRCTDRG